MTNNKLIVFTGPSGVGKATIEKHLFEDKELNLKLSCSATTRPPREGEVDGVHYHFLSAEEFDKKIENDEFIEWNAHFSNKYGTLKSEVQNIAATGKVPFLEVETEGAKNVINEVGNDKLISIFILPPSVDDIAERLRNRGTETEEQISQRVKRVQEEIEVADVFQHKVVNDDLMRAVKEIKEIILKEL